MKCRIYLLTTIGVLLFNCTPDVSSDQRNRISSEIPNILFISIDDLRPELGCYGTVAKTPAMDRLADNGVRFALAYCQMALCSPSRTSVMTGLRPDSTKIYDLETHFRSNVPNVVTLSQYFKQHGYLATGAGKIYHSNLEGDSLNDNLSWSIPFKKFWLETRRNYA